MGPRCFRNENRRSAEAWDTCSRRLWPWWFPSLGNSCQCNSPVWDWSSFNAIIIVVIYVQPLIFLFCPTTLCSSIYYFSPEWLTIIKVCHFIISPSSSLEIGIGLCLIGSVCIFLGVMFMFERTLLSLGNLSFMVGLMFLLGYQKTIKFFFRREKKIASFCFFLGFFLVLFGWAFIGSVIQLYGFWKLFSAFIPNVIHSLKMIPGVGFMLDLPGIRTIVGYAYDQRRLPL